ncbi:MAG: sigma-70 region 4 domain-containing protein, partial [Acidobacteriota bacterium]|nr:sigma-70 region 4 domain-containing protein [Acidobacteriota bacterium]
MTRIDELPPDQRAVLSLILRRGKRYGEIAQALGLAEAEVRERAHDALEALAGGTAHAGERAIRERIGDLLRGQLGAAERLIAYDELEGSADARDYAETLTKRLADLGVEGLDGLLPPTPPARAQGPGAQRAGAGEPASDERVARPALASPAPAMPAPVRQPVRDFVSRASQAIGSQAAAGRGALRRLIRARPAPRSRAAARAATAPPVSRTGGAIVLALIAAAAIAAVLVATLGG